MLNPKIQESGHERTESLSLIRNATMESITEEEKQKGTWYIFFHFGNSSTPGLLYHTKTIIIIIIVSSKVSANKDIDIITYNLKRWLR